MSNGQLTLEYKKDHVPSVGYFIETLMKSSGTTPDDLYDCLVVNKGDAGSDELIARVATYAEIFTTPLPILPDDVDRFSAPSMTVIPGGPQIGDEIQIGLTTLPPIWQHVYGYSGGIHTITTVISPTMVEVTPAFPGFARNIAWDYIQASVSIHSGTDGLANRDFGIIIGTLFRTRQHADMWETFKLADDKYNALRGEAQSLVDAYNEDTFTGDVEETYTS